MPLPRGRSLYPISPSTLASSSQLSLRQTVIPPILCLRFGIKLHRAPSSCSLQETPVPGCLPRATPPSLPACVGNLTFHSELNCHPLSCAAANYKHITNCSVQHNPSVMDLINPSSAPIPPWTAFLCRKRTIPQTIINPSDA